MRGRQISRLNAGLWVALVSGGALAHPFNLYSGTIVPTERGIAVSFALNADAARHESVRDTAVWGPEAVRDPEVGTLGGPPVSAAYLSQLADDLAASIIVTDPTGMAIPPSAVSKPEFEGTVTIIFETDAPVVALEHRPGGSIASMPRQFQFRVSGEADEGVGAGGARVQGYDTPLTSAGNYAVVRVGRSDTPFDHARFTTPRVWIGASDRSLTIDYPASVLGSFSGVPRIVNGFVATNDYADAGPELERWATARLVLRNRAGGAVPFRVRAAGLIGPDAKPITVSTMTPAVDDLPTGWVSALTARCRFEIEADGAYETVEWSGFHSTLLGVEVRERSNTGVPALRGILNPSAKVWPPTVRAKPSLPTQP